MATKRKGQEPAEGLQVFREAVKDLETKSQSKIKNLTELAQELYGQSANIVQVVADEIVAATPERIQPLLFVIDSILKKVGKDYKVHFAERLPDALRAACQKSDDAGRTWLQRMVQESWQKHELLPLGVFPQLLATFQMPQVPLMQQMPGGMPQATPMTPTTPGKVASATAELEPRQAEDGLVERRLRILTKIIERKPARPDELQEIMKVPEIRRAIAMQQKNQRQEATALLSQFKQELERRHKEITEQKVTPKDPRLQKGRAQDPRMEKPSDPREAKPADPRARKEAPKEPPKKKVKAEEKDQEVTTILSDNEVEVEDEEVAPLVPARHFLQGMPSIGFSEAWLRQFMSQVPRTRGRGSKAQVGRKVLGASGEQLVYVDAISPGEMLLLMQFVFMLEEKLRSTGRGVDLAQRVSHSFSFLQVDLAVDVMLKWVFDGLPFQCETTGLRFSTREKLRRHNEGLKKRKEQRQMNAEARGWMDAIPDWVGNRDLVVGPALFRLGTVEGKVSEREVKALETEIEEESEVPFDARRSVCPISGERLDRTWSSTLNDWAFADAIASEMHSLKPLRFPPGGPIGPHGLSESALIFKKSCFANTSLSRRMDALVECSRSVSKDGSGVEVAQNVGKEDAELQSLKPLPARKFF